MLRGTLWHLAFFLAFIANRGALMLKGRKKWGSAAFMLILAGLIMAPSAAAGESANAFRQQNGLVAYDPPAWFMEGYFIAREKNPGFVFGPLQDFVGGLGDKKTWLIEDLELQRIERASAGGTNVEYSLYLESVLPGYTQYWVFVALPYETAREWFDARRAYHGSKAEGYYGETQGMLERAFGQGFKIKAELRFLIEKKEIRLEPPEDLIMKRYKYQPIYDLAAGRRLDLKTKTQ